MVDWRNAFGVSQPVSDIDDVTARRKAWQKYFIKWKFLSWFLTIAIAAGSTYVASSLSRLNHREEVALAVAFFAALLTTLNPEKRAQSYREAWIILDLAIKKQNAVAPELLDALRAGENKIGDSHAEEPNPKPS